MPQQLHHSIAWKQLQMKQKMLDLTEKHLKKDTYIKEKTVNY